MKRIRCASQLCRVLEGAWSTLVTLVPDLPANVFIVPTDQGRRTLGHFAHQAWRMTPDGAHEVGVAPKLFETPEDVVLVLLHEAAHGILYGRGLMGGCSANGHYHKKQFRDACRDLGLLCDFTDTRHGWNNTKFPEDGLPEKYLPVRDYLRDNLTAGHVRQTPLTDNPARPLPRSGRVSLRCGCGRRIHAARSVAEAGGIHCSFCDSAFEIDEADRSDAG